MFLRPLHSGSLTGWLAGWLVGKRAGCPVSEPSERRAPNSGRARQSIYCFPFCCVRLFARTSSRLKAPIARRQQAHESGPSRKAANEQVARRLLGRSVSRPANSWPNNYALASLSCAAHLAPLGKLAGRAGPSRAEPSAILLAAGRARKCDRCSALASRAAHPLRGAQIWNRPAGR